MKINSAVAFGHDQTERSNQAGPANVGNWGMAQVIWSVPTSTRAVAFTFDDGPDPEFTPRVLDALATVGASATFMMMGHNADRHPDLVAEVVRRGHEVGHHSWSHQDAAYLDQADIRQEIQRGLDAVARASGQTMRWYRPPRGILPGLSLQICAELHQDVLMWSLNGGLPDRPTEDQLVDHILRNSFAGCVIDNHDGIGRGTFDREGRQGQSLRARRETEVRALPRILSRLQEAGYRFLTVSQLLAEPRQSGS
jgi:peptidoglycan/xylan/chitin deacetylase (PgdA/CDA1 family)